MTSSKTGENSNLKLTVFWGDVIYDTALLEASEKVTIGPKLGNNFNLPLGISSLEMIEVHPDKSATIRFTKEMSGHLRVGSEFMSLGNAIQNHKVTVANDETYSVKLKPSDKADFVVGHVSFYLDWVERREKIPTTAINRGRLGFVLALLAIAVILPVILGSIDLKEEVEPPPERLVTLMPRPQAAKAAMGERKSADGGAQTGEAGKANTVTEEKPSAAESLRKANLGSLVSGLTSIGAKAPSQEAQPNAVKGTVNQVGTGGFSTEGLKTGGGGKSVGIGRQVGRGEGGFEGTGRLGLSGDAAVEGGTGHGTYGNNREGDYDRDVIENIIRKRQDRIRLCYERQLNFFPKLRGKITVHFVIGKAGEVVSAAAAEDTLKNPSVLNCVLHEVKSWNFPTPQGGVLVNVDYPFVFESTAKAGG